MSETVLVVSEQRKKKGLWWLIGPYLVFIACLVLYGVLGFVLRSINVSTVFLNLIVGIVGLVSMILLPVGLIVAIYQFTKKTEMPSADFDPNSGRGDASVVPAELKKWSWGAAGLNIIWGMYHGVWISFLALVPGLGIIWWIFMGIKGNEWAWRNGFWKSLEDYKQKQKSWDRWGLVLFIIGLVFIVGYIAFASVIMSVIFSAPSTGTFNMDSGYDLNTLGNNPYNLK